MKLAIWLMKLAASLMAKVKEKQEENASITYKKALAYGKLSDTAKAESKIAGDTAIAILGTLSNLG